MEAEQAHDRPDSEQKKWEQMPYHCQWLAATKMMQSSLARQRIQRWRKRRNLGHRGKLARKREGRADDLESAHQFSMLREQEAGDEQGSCSTWARHLVRWRKLR